MIREAYETEYALYDHDDPSLQHAFQGSLMTDKKRILKRGPVNEMIRRYHRFRIQKYFGISLIEYFKLPADRFDAINDIAIEFIEEEQKSFKDMEKQIEHLDNASNTAKMEKEYY